MIGSIFKLDLDSNCHFIKFVVIISSPVLYLKGWTFQASEDSARSSIAMKLDNSIFPKRKVTSNRRPLLILT